MIIETASGPACEYKDRFGDYAAHVADRLYLEERAEREIFLAQASDHPAVVRAHYLLAGYYLDRLYGQDNEPVNRSGNRSFLSQNDA
jgi:hypothetical protein